MRQRVGLAGAGACNDQQRRCIIQVCAAVLHSPPLLRVQPGQMGVISDLRFGVQTGAWACLDSLG
jgi:hypothetical protein